jgi:hypothetical protein
MGTDGKTFSELNLKQKAFVSTALLFTISDQLAKVETETSANIEPNNLTVISSVPGSKGYIAPNVLARRQILLKAQFEAFGKEGESRHEFLEDMGLFDPYNKKVSNREALKILVVDSLIRNKNNSSADSLYKDLVYIAKEQSFTDYLDNYKRAYESPYIRDATITEVFGMEFDKKQFDRTVAKFIQIGLILIVLVALFAIFRKKKKKS